MKTIDDTWERAQSLGIREIRAKLDPLDELASFEFDPRFQRLLAQNITDICQDVKDLTVRELVHLVKITHRQFMALSKQPHFPSQLTLNIEAA